MQQFSQHIIDQLESKGLFLFRQDRFFRWVAKPVGIPGNCIEGRIREPIVEFEEVDGEFAPKKEQFKTDAPALSILIEPNGFRVQVWNWVPGPGPGDFDTLVETEEEACALIINYFFEENEHFEAYRQYHMNNDNT